MKHSLLSYASKPHRAAAVGDVIPGFVKKATDTSVIVDYVDGSSVSIKAQHLADRNISHPGSVYHPGQTVFTVVTRVAPAKGDGSLKVEGASLKPSAFDDVGRRVQHDLAYMEGLFIEQEMLQTVGLKKSAAVDAAAFVSKFAIGSVVVAVVKQKAPAGFLVDVEKGAASGVLTVELGNTDVEVGQTISARVVDLDYAKKSLDLRVASVAAAVEGEDKKKKNKKKLEALDAEDEVSEKLAHAINQKHIVDAVVELIKTDYVVLSLASLGNRIVYSPIRNFNSAGDTNAVKNYRLGQKVKVSLFKAAEIKKKFDGLYAQ
ncbi:UNVERIFIED_CONTAM: hypothetical protein HDU68_006957, partial [Siphonaria sp. JEL0065]